MTFAATVTVQEAALPLEEVAVMVADPADIAVTLPLASTVATEVSLELHAMDLSVALSGLTVAVMVAVSPSVRLNTVLLRVMLST